MRVTSCNALIIDSDGRGLLALRVSRLIIRDCDCDRDQDHDRDRDRDREAEINS